MPTPNGPQDDDNDDNELSFAPTGNDVEDDIEYEVVEDAPDTSEDDAAGADDEPDETDEGEPEADDAEDSDDTDDAEDSDEEDEELKGYSKNVKKRIQREVAIRRRVEEELVDVKTKASGYISKLHEEGKRTYEKATALQKQYDDMQDSYAQLLESSFVEKSEFLREKLRRAKDEGQTEAEVAALSELQTLAQQRAELNNISRTIKTSRETREGLKNIWEPPRSTQAAPQQQTVQPTTRGAQWIKGRTWYGKQKHQDATEFARVIDKQLARDGYDTNSKEFFVELDRRVAKRFPELYSKKKPSGTAAAPVASGTSRSTPSKGKVQLTRTDLQRMQRFGLDPQNKAHLREWAKQKGTQA